MTDIERFAALFEGNPDVHGNGDPPHYVDSPPSWYSHLEGTCPIGIYPIYCNQVHWGCVDIDVPDLTHVYNLQQALVALGIHSVAELSKGKGYHVWVLLEQDAWVQTRFMRRALQVACTIAEAPDREVNPKQEQLAEGQVGNYVRLPYPNRGAGGRQVFGHVGMTGKNLLFTPFTFERGVEYAESRVNDVYPILEAAKLWTPPKQKHVAMNLDLHDAVQRGLSYGVTERLKSLPLTRRLMEEGGGDDCDRSSTLTHLAYLAAEARFDPSDVLSILIEADLTWAHKYIHRDKSDRELRRIVTRVFG